MNLLGMAIIAGGMVMPIGHGTLRFLTRKNRQLKGASHDMKIAKEKRSICSRPRSASGTGSTPLASSP